MYKEWIKPSTPIYMKYYVFNVTNPNEIFEGLEIPNVTQIGPYSYRYVGRDETSPGGSPLYDPYKDVLLDRVWFFTSLSVLNRVQSNLH